MTSARPTETLSLAEARRIAIAAQGLTLSRPRAEPARAHLNRVIDHVGLLQIDSVNVISRSHYLPVFARLGPYAHKVVDAAAWGPRRSLFEYWAHEASMLPVETQPLFRWRMAEAEAGVGLWKGVHRFAVENRAFVKAVLKEIEQRGPTTAGGLSDCGKAAGGWWGWSKGKRAVEWLFWAGHITTRTRKGFERVYDLPERCLPRAVVDQPTPTPEDAQRRLIRIAARAMGVATETDLRDYFRMDVASTRARIAELVEAGELTHASVQGWNKPAYLAPGAAAPRRVRTSALLSPFDSLVWNRPRAARLFDFHYRLEIYTPAHKRVHGYYVLPWLLNDRIAARLDLKADRKARRLLVQSAHPEHHAAPAAIADPLRADLESMAGWLGLEAVEVRGVGPLAEALK